MKSQFIFAFAALLMIASLITEGDCLYTNYRGKVIYWNENIIVRLGQFFPTDLLKKKTNARKKHIVYSISCENEIYLLEKFIFILFISIALSSAFKQSLRTK